MSVGIVRELCGDVEARVWRKQRGVRPGVEVERGGAPCALVLALVQREAEVVCAVGCGEASGAQRAWRPARCPRGIGRPPTQVDASAAPPAAKNWEGAAP